MPYIPTSLLQTYIISYNYLNGSAPAFLQNYSGYYRAGYNDWSCPVNCQNCLPTYSTLSDPNNCGQCNRTCAIASNSTPICVNGTCTILCIAGYADCDGNITNGCETSLSSASTCGSCNNNCSSLPNAIGVCSNMACVILSCLYGYSDCDRNTSNGCEYAGVCPGTCAVHLGDCNHNATDGCETLLNSVNHCAQCNSSCSYPNAISSCSFFQCSLFECDPTFGNCDGITTNGCETQLITLQHCGQCDQSCSLSSNYTTECVTNMNNNNNNGVALASCSYIQCSFGFANCDLNSANGCETNIESDQFHCGACNASVCSFPHAIASCSNFTCIISQCDQGYFNIDNNLINGCEHSSQSLIPPDSFTSPFSLTPLPIHFSSPSSSTNPFYAPISNINPITISSSSSSHVIVDPSSTTTQTLVNYLAMVNYSGTAFQPSYSINNNSTLILSITSASNETLLSAAQQSLKQSQSNNLIASSIVDITITGGKLSSNIQVCIPFNFTSPPCQFCLAFINSTNQQWQCQDHQLIGLKTNYSSNHHQYLCGSTNHLTNFALLFIGVAGKEQQYIFKNGLDDLALILSVAVFIITIILIISCVLYSPVFKKYVIGKEGARLQTLRDLELKVKTRSLPAT